MQEENQIFEASISEFGKLKPMIPKNQFSRDIEYSPDEYILILISTEQFADEVCKEISDREIASSKEWVERVSNFISAKNVNIESLEKSFNYKTPNDARGDCNSIPKKNQFVLDDILKLVSKVKTDLDDSKKHNRQARINLLRSRIKGNESDAISELTNKKKIISNQYSYFTKEVNVVTHKEAFITDWTWLISYLFTIIRNASNYSVSVYTKAVAVIGLIAILNKYLSNSLKDRNTAMQLPFTKKILFYEAQFSDSLQLLEETRYIITNDKEKKLPGFDEIAAGLDFQISNYEELYYYFLSKEGIEFKTKEIQEICEKHKCNRKPDIELLKKNAKVIVEELKKQRIANSH